MNDQIHPPIAFGLADKIVGLRKKQRELRKAARDYLKAVAYVPMRAVDCDQGEVERTERKLADLCGYKR